MPNRSPKRHNILLDRSGDGRIPPGYRLITTERDFVSIATKGSQIVIRGERLCRWAEDFYKGRSSEYAFTESPVRALHSIFPGLSETDAISIWQQFGTDWEWPITFRAVLQSIWPEFRWFDVPSRSHAAHWLVWLADSVGASYFSVLIQPVVSDFKENASIEYRALYTGDRDEARDILARWLGLSDDNHRQDLGPFPIKVPEIWRQKAQSLWGSDLISMGLPFFDVVRRRGVPNDLLQMLAILCCHYAKQYPERLDRKTSLRLTQYVPSLWSDELRKLCPPQRPDMPPDTVDDLYQWFINGYMPYRQWQVNFGDDDARDWITSLARSFGLWYLERYPAAIAGGAFHDRLAIVAAGRLPKRPRDNRVLFWVILDGLHVVDADSFSRHLQEEPRLTVTNTTYAFATLPTITQFCKPSLLSGLPPVRSMEPTCGELFPDAVRLEANKDASTRTGKAIAGTVYVWKVDEPDKSYHKQFDVHTIRHNVEGELNTFANRVIEAVLAVPDGILVDIIVSTDHGRMIGSCARDLPVPAGMEAHGRAAWSVCQPTYDSNYVISEVDNTAYLPRVQFGLSTDTCIALGDAMFMRSDGGGGTEVSTHGGVFPEEIITPWIEFSRDVVLPKLDAVISGRGRAGRTQSVSIDITNPASIAVTVLSLQLNLGKKTFTIEVNETIEPMSKSIAGGIKRELASWPSSHDIEGATAILSIQLQNGTLFMQEARLTLESKEMYKQDFSLKDLL